MTCLTCVHWDARKTKPEIRRLHLARCALGPVWEYLPMQASCSSFAKVGPEMERARMEWKAKVEKRCAA